MVNTPLPCADGVIRLTVEGVFLDRDSGEFRFTDFDPRIVF